MWVRDLVIFLVGCLIAWLGGMLLPVPFSTVAYVIGGIIAIVALVLLLIHLFTGGPRIGANPNGVNPRGPVV